MGQLHSLLTIGVLPGSSQECILLDLPNLVLHNAPGVICTVVVLPLAALTCLMFLTGLVVLFAGQRRSDRALRLFNAVLDALVWLTCGVLRWAPKPRKEGPQRNTRRRSR